MIRVAVRQRPCPGRGCWSGSIRRKSVWEEVAPALSGEQVPGVSWPQFGIITGRISALERTFC